MAWTALATPALCRALVSAGPVLQIHDEAEFRRVFCRDSDLDWASLELFAYRPSIDSGRAFVTEDVVLGEAELNWLLSPLPCSVSHFDSPLAAILVRRRGLPVVARLKPDSFVHCPPSAEGYAY